MTTSDSPYSAPPADAALHETRTEWRAGRSLGRVYRTPNATLEARLDADGAALHRLTGPHTPDVTLRWDDLAALARAFERWREVRDEWAAYYEKGVVGASFAAQVYWPAGRAAERRAVGFAGQVPPERAGIRFGSTDALRPFESPRAVAPSIEAIAELWRTELRIGPRGGERVGERWLLDGGVVIDVRRTEARSIDGRGRFTWLAYEADVPGELLALRSTLGRGAAA
jgi:hypothetical protein